MAYTKKTWIDNESYADADSMNNIENGIYNNDAHIGDLNDLETDDKTNLVEAINEVTTKGSGVTLYENASGSNGNITFNQSAVNFRFLEIHYGASSTSISVSKFKVGSTKISLQRFIATQDTLYFRYTTYSLSNTAMSVDQVFNYDIYRFNSSINPKSTDNACYITKVIGIR